jgi:hypothetical protein
MMRSDVIASSAVSWIESHRAAAAKAWSELPWPAAKDPLWRYSPPALFESGSYAADGAVDFAAGLSPASERSESGDGAYAEVFRFIDGAPASCCLDASAPKGLSVSLGAEDFPSSAARFLGGPELADKLRSRLWAESGPFLGIELGAEAQLEKPLLVDWVDSRRGVYASPVILLRLGEGSRARVIVRWRSPRGSGAAADILLSPALLVEMASGSALELFELAELSHASRLLDFPQAILGNGAELSWTRGFFGCRASRSRLEATLEGQGARLELREACAAGSSQHIELAAKIRHVGAHTWSRVALDGIADGDGSAIASGLLAIDKTATGTDAYLSSRHLSLSPKAKVMSMPELAIDTDDLVASHGATVGSVGPDELFYLETRGLSPAQAKAAVAAGLLSRLVEKSPAELAAHVGELVDEALHG